MSRSRSKEMSTHDSRYQRRTIFLTIALMPVVYFVSVLLLSHYVNGDQWSYHNFYNEISGKNFSEARLLAVEHVSSREPLSVLVLWVGSNLGIAKNIYISFLNVVFISALFLFLRKCHVGTLETVLFLTGFYVIVLMTAAERLKIAYIVLLFSALSTGWMRVFFVSLSPSAHLQSLILFPSLLLASLDSFLKELFLAGWIHWRKLAFLVISFAGAGVILYIFIEPALQKTESSSSIGFNLGVLANLVVLSVVALYASSNRFRMGLALAPFFPAVGILSGDRVNMIAVSLVFYILVTERRFRGPVVIMMLTYFSAKTIPFIGNIFRYGDGFGGPLW